MNPDNMKNTDSKGYPVDRMVVLNTSRLWCRFVDSFYMAANVMIT